MVEHVRSNYNVVMCACLIHNERFILQSLDQHHYNLKKKSFSIMNYASFNRAFNTIKYYLPSDEIPIAHASLMCSVL